MRLLALVAAVIVLPAVLAQAPQSSSQKDAAPVSTLSTGTQLVVVDVVVQDKDGHPIHGLTKDDFRLEENKAPQNVRTFDEHNEATALAQKRPAVPPLPPGTFTSYSNVPDNGTLTVLLLDRLNTVTTDQSYVRKQLQKYLREADPNARIAIFGMSARLTLLQGFTSDPAILRAAIDNKGKASPSLSLADPLGTGYGPQTSSNQMYNTLGIGGTMQAAIAAETANLNDFETENTAMQDTFRIRYTLDSFNQLARYLAAFPGRKNLIWFSGSFPISIEANVDITNPNAVTADFTDAFRETSTLLTRARVAVYPADASETQHLTTFTQPISGASQSRPDTFGSRDNIDRARDSETSSRATMAQMAEDTGGQPYMSGRPLADVVRQTINSGADYYTLTYSPANRDWKGEYRNIRVLLQGASSERKLKLSYRHGYFADDPNNRHNARSTSLIAASAVAAPTTGSAAYAYAAMRRGGPPLSEVLFTARVLPASTTIDEKVAPHNSANPNAKIKGPYRLIDIDIAALPRNFELAAPDENGTRRATIEYVTYVYDTDGHILNTDTTTREFAFTPQKLKELAVNGIGFRQQVSVPAKTESYLRIAMHDVPSGRFGVIEIPASAVLSLPPAPAVPGAP